MRRWRFFLAHSFAVQALACLLLRTHQPPKCANLLLGLAAEWRSKNARR